MLKTDDGAFQSELTIDVDDYLRSEEWTLPAAKRASRGGNGSSIEVTRLTTEASKLFSDDEWVARLTATIGQRYSHFIEKGLLIRIGITEVQAKPVRLRENGPFPQKYKAFRISGGVSVHVRCGQHAAHRFNKEPDYNAETNKRITSEFGWTVTCNDRSIVINDTTYRTGWDTKFHSEFYGFCGEIQFISRNPGLLPWDTTKSDVDLHNEAYQHALSEMKKFAADWRKFQPERKRAGREGKPLPTIPPVTTTTSTLGPKLQPKTFGVVPKPTPSPVKKSSYNDVREVLPEDINEAWVNDKLLVLVHEAKLLDLGTHSYCGLALLRMLFEQAVLQLFNRSETLDAFSQFYLERRRKGNAAELSKDEARRPPTLDEMISYLESHPNAWGEAKSQHLKHSLANAKKRKPLMNGVVHNPYQIVDRTDAYAIRNELLPILRHFIETKEAR
jgi:hypothetical protein